MRPLNGAGPTGDEHAAAVSRRLATLSAELAAVRGDPPLPHRHTQLREVGRPVAAVHELAPAVPVPGRHASRGRLGWSWGGLSARLPLRAAHVAAVSVVLAAAVGLAAWFAVRSEPEAVPELVAVSEPLTSAAATQPGDPATAPETATATAGAGVTVDVAGKVRRPGIAVLEPGARVVDALEAAGGARQGVDLSSLNLARPLVDGEQILVGVPVQAGVIGSLGSPDAAGPGAGGPLVNLNSADVTALETLPGVGPVTAEAIIGWRTEHGGFSAVAELLEVDGIGDATLADIAPHVTL